MEQIDQFDESLQRHVLSTYFGLRLGMGVIALLFPLLLCIGGGVIACCEKTTKYVFRSVKSAVAIVGVSARRQNAPSFPDSGSGSQQ